MKNLINDILVLKDINMITRDNTYVLSLEFRNSDLKMVNKEIEYGSYNAAIRDMAMILRTV